MFAAQPPKIHNMHEQREAEATRRISEALAEHPTTIRAQRDAYRAALRVIAVTEWGDGPEPFWHREAREVLERIDGKP